ncbi:unnamed protein product, partial [Mesorhabditis belari]|uniref:glutathione transferase n=1 Tax=Mesorhabditis belari TaxID=2138241 RepID=A0AAF3F0J6_9BILA
MTDHHYKYTYFDLGGRGEVTRQLFALAGIPFEDIRIKWENKEEWEALKADTPFGQLPTLEIDGGEKMAQSRAINRYLGRKFGFAGTNDFEAFQIDEFEDAMTDYFGEQAGFFAALVGEGPGDKDQLYKSHFEPARDKFFPIVIERYLKRSNSEFLTSKISYADLRLAIHVSGFEKLVPHCFDKYPQIIAHKERIEAIPEIKKWLETRPKKLY